MIFSKREEILCIEHMLICVIVNEINALSVFYMSFLYGNKVISNQSSEK